jgi:molybdenum cofactor synthesis domain-containing protein
MIEVQEAIQRILDRVEPLLAEEVSLDSALGRVLAEEIVADSDLPPFNRAQMDGYAVRSGDTTALPARLKVVGESAAGRGWSGSVNEGEAVRIMTGAPVPSGADSVQKVEVTSEVDGFVELTESTQAGQFIVPRASEIKERETVLKKGTRLNAAMMAALAAFGYAGVKVSKRPHVSVIATGSELVPVAKTPATDQIRDSNSFSIGAYAQLAGAIVDRLPLASDDPRLLEEMIDRAAGSSDMVVLSGGVSMGVYDFTKVALRNLGAEIFFERVSLRPGKPTVFGRLRDTWIFGLPGNPVSVSVTFNLFARTALLRMQGASNCLLEGGTAILSRPVKGAVERASYLPAILSTNDDGLQLAQPLKWGGSSDFVAFTAATALIIVPSGIRSLDSGSVVQILRLP